MLVGLHRHNFSSLPPPTFARACAYVEEYGWLTRLECVCVPACVFMCVSFSVACVGVLCLPMCILVCVCLLE